MTPPLATIGYEKATLPDVLGRLKAAKIELLIDVRAVAASRRAGFSKTLLSGSLNAEGIDYLHLRDLGTPKAGRQAAKAGRTDEMRAIFAVHMQTDAAQMALEHAVDLSRQKAVCLLCFEADHSHCHRAILADLIQPRTDARVLHL